MLFSSFDLHCVCVRDKMASIITAVSLLWLALLPTILQAHNADNQTHAHTHSVDSLNKDTATLDCPVLQTQSRFIHWVTPGDLIINANFTGSRFRELMPGNYSLHIERVEEQALGDYLCLVENDEGVQRYYRTTLYLYQEPRWDLYKDNFIIAICCSAGFLLVVGLILVVYSCRWRPSQSDVLHIQEPTNGYVNATYEMGSEKAGNDLDYPVKRSLADEAPDTKM